jgi:hypothetical protein
VKHIDEARLENDLGYRFGYVSEFMGFGPDDVETIHAAAGPAPLVPALVDAVYDKLIGYDATWRHFLPRQHGTRARFRRAFRADDGSRPDQFRKQHLARYLAALVTKPYDARMVGYLDTVGKIHTAKAGAPEIQVPLVQMNALLGFVADALTATILGLGLPRQREVQTLRAFGKLLWLQNDLINRHYAAPEMAVQGNGRAALAHA